MGFINNQWLKAAPERSRGHGPLEVKMEAEKPTTKWDEDHDVLVQLKVTRHGGDYQHVLFTADDLANLLSFALKEEQARETLVNVLGKQTDRKVLTLLAQILHEHVANKSGKQV